MDPIDISVATYSAAAVAGSAAPITVISNEVIRPAFIPGGSILRTLLTKEDVPSRGATATTSANAPTSEDASKFNLLEGLGEDFFNQEPMDDEAIARILDEIAPSAAAPPSVDAKMEIAPRAAAAAADVKMEIAPSAAAAAADVKMEIAPSAAAAEPRVSPLPQSPRSHFSQSQTSSTPGAEPLSPVLTGRKRRFFRGGKGRKILKLSREEEGGSLSSSSASSLPSTQLFSQPEHKVLVRDYHNFICQVEEQVRLCEQREGELQIRLSSLTSRREEVEARLRSLLTEEAEVRAECESQQKQLAKHRRRLAALLGVGE